MEREGEEGGKREHSAYHTLNGTTKHSTTSWAILGEEQCENHYSAS